MIAGMTATRITITVDHETATQLRAAVAPGEVSAFVVEAIRQRLRVDPVRALLSDLDALHGPVSSAQRKAGDEWYDASLRRLSSTPER